MDWDKLRIFKAVAEAGSLTHAGEELNLSQSAVSRQISALEDSLGIPLFHRHARGLILTEQGEILLQTTKDVFEKLQHVETELSDSRLLPEGPLTITTVEFIASTWLAPKLADFKAAYPDIHLTMLLDDRVYDLGRREADVAIRLQKTDQIDLIERPIMTLDFHLCASKEYLKKHGKPQTPDDLRNHILIGYPLNLQAPFQKPNWIFNSLNIDLSRNKNVILLNSMNARYTAVRNHAGIAVLPSYIALEDQKLEVLFPELAIPPVEMYFVYPQERRNSKKIAVLKDFLLENIKN
jgi:DNA-binding transcriptional LysR family regulator